MSWQMSSLGDIAKVGAGNSAPQGGHFFSPDGFPFFRTSDVGRIRFGQISESADRLNEAGIRGLRLLPRGAILFPKSGASTFLNHRVMLDVDGFVSSHLATIVADESRVLAKYLLYFLATVKAQNLVQDHAYPSLNLPVISGIGVPLPSIPEQQRIVAILDEAFAGIAIAKANAEKCLQSSVAVFHSHRDFVFASGGESWKQGRIEEWCESITDCVNKTAPVVESETPFRMIRTTNVRNGRVDISSVKFVSEATYNIWTRRQIPRRGDVILTREAPMGEVGRLLTDHQIFLGQRLVAYRADERVLDGAFLCFAMQSSSIQRQIHEKASGSTVQHMRVPDTKNLVLSAPPLREQRQIVARLESLGENTQHLESLYTRKLAALEALKQSLLHQAFSGEL